MTEPKRFSSDHYAGGQPSPQDLAELAREGVRTVINLRSADEPVDYDEASEAGRLGLCYECLPISGPSDLDSACIERFGRLLDAARAKGGVLIHCASSNRAGAMVALDAALSRGAPIDVAIQRGRDAGLVGLEPVVRDIIANTVA